MVTYTATKEVPGTLVISINFGHQIGLFGKESVILIVNLDFKYETKIIKLIACRTIPFVIHLRFVAECSECEFFLDLSQGRTIERIQAEPASDIVWKSLVNRFPLIPESTLALLKSCGKKTDRSSGHSLIHSFNLSIYSSYDILCLKKM